MSFSQISNGDTGLQARTQLNNLINFAYALTHEPHTAYCSESLGNDATAALGNPSLPYATANAAYAALSALSGTGLRLHVIDGNVGNIVLTSGMSKPLMVTGNGAHCVIQGILAAGANGGTGGEAEPGGAGTAGFVVDLISDGSVSINTLTTDGGGGGDGGDGGFDSAATNGGAGNTSGSLRLRGILRCGAITARGGNGGTGNAYGGAGGTGGDVGLVLVDGLVFCESFSASAGTGGGSAGGGSSGSNGNGPGVIAGCFIRGLRSSGSIYMTGAGGGAIIVDSFGTSLDSGSGVAVACYTHGSLPSW